jgi:hypothetical protein
MKAKWIGPESSIPDLGLRLAPGDEFELPDDLTLGGEGETWERKTTKKPEPEKE